MQQAGLYGTGRKKRDPRRRGGQPYMQMPVVGAFASRLLIPAWGYFEAFGSDWCEDSTIFWAAKTMRTFFATCLRERCPRAPAFPIAAKGCLISIDSRRADGFYL